MGFCRLALLDSGVTPEHGLARRIIRSRSFVSERVLLDTHGHGSACGAAFEAGFAMCGGHTEFLELVYAKIFSSSEPRCSTTVLTESLRWIASCRPDVVAIPCSTPCRDPNLSAIVARLVDLQAAIVCAVEADAAGNPSPSWPAGCPGVLRVRGGSPATDSSRGVMYLAARVASDLIARRRNDPSRVGTVVPGEEPNCRGSQGDRNRCRLEGGHGSTTRNAARPPRIATRNDPGRDSRSPTSRDIFLRLREVGS